MNSSAIVREAVLLVRDFDGPAGKPREAAHLTFAGDLKKPNDRVPAPDRAAVDDPGDSRFVDVDRLVVTKLTGFRDKNRTHPCDMIDVGLINATARGGLPEPLQSRHQQLRDALGG